MDAPLALGLWDALDAVGAALVLEDRVRPVALDLHDHFLVAADLRRTRSQDAVLEVQTVSVPGVHLEEFAREKGRLIAAGSGPDLQDNVLVVVRVAVY